MLLVIDVGNTNIVIGIYRQDRLLHNWRVRTEHNTTEDEFFLLANGLFASGSIATDDINRVVISCVVPPMVTILDSFCRKYLGRPPIWVDAHSYAGMPIQITNPDEVGADRIVNGVAAYHKYRTALVVIDFGTATTFDAISAQGEYLGGAICPGVMIASEALFQKASKLPRVDILKPPAVTIGKDTISSIQSGLIYGYAGLVDGMVARMRRELAPPVRVVATGGLAKLIASVSESIEAVEPDLTLEGLRIISKDILGGS